MQLLFICINYYNVINIGKNVLVLEYRIIFFVFFLMLFSNVYDVDYYMVFIYYC